MEESKENFLEKSAEKLTKNVQNMANYRSLYNEIQVSVMCMYYMHQ